MTDPKPIACTLGASDLRQRLEEIAALGADSLLGHEERDGAHTLRFRLDDRTRRRLEEIVAAEAQCCSFLDLEVSERDGDLVLTITSPEAGKPVADELALAFTRMRGERGSLPRMEL
jgi:hypothetical protein